MNISCKRKIFLISINNRTENNNIKFLNWSKNTTIEKSQAYRIVEVYELFQINSKFPRKIVEYKL